MSDKILNLTSKRLWFHCEDLNMYWIRQQVDKRLLRGAKIIVAYVSCGNKVSDILILLAFITYCLIAV